MRPRHFLSAVTAACLWGGGGVVGVLFGDHVGLSPLGVAVWRMAVAGVTLLGALAILGRLDVGRWGRPEWTRIAITGILTALFEAAFFTSIALSSVGLATLIGIGSAPVFVATYDAVVRRVRPSARASGALVLALAGLTLLVGGGLVHGDRILGGAVVALGAGASFAAITVVNRRPVPGLNPVELTGGAFSVGAIVLLPFAAATGLAAPADAYGWALALGMGVVITGVAYVLYLTALATVPPFVATVVTLLEPLIGAILGSIVFAERLGLAGAAGGVLLGTAVVLLRPQRDESALVPEPPTMVQDSGT